MTATYCTDADLYLAFGEGNVKKWADVENEGLYSSVEARLDWARAAAYAELNSRLADSRYQFPLDDAGPYPNLLVRMEAYLAAVLLYESRGVTDVGPKGNAMHALQWHRKRVEQFIHDVHSNRITLDVTMREGAVSEITEAPDFVSFDDPSPLAASAPEVKNDLIEWQ